MVLPNELITLIFHFQETWKYNRQKNELVSLKKLHSFCTTYFTYQYKINNLVYLVYQKVIINDKKWYRIFKRLNGEPYTECKVEYKIYTLEESPRIRFLMQEYVPRGENPPCSIWQKISWFVKKLFNFF